MALAASSKEDKENHFNKDEMEMEMETAILSYRSASSETVFKQLNNLQIDNNSQVDNVCL